MVNLTFHPSLQDAAPRFLPIVGGGVAAEGGGAEAEAAAAEAAAAEVGAWSPWWLVRAGAPGHARARLTTTLAAARMSIGGTKGWAAAGLLLSEAIADVGASLKECKPIHPFSLSLSLDTHWTLTGHSLDTHWTPAPFYSHSRQFSSP